jgi:phosphatidylglycerophosphate synthase
MKLHRASGNDWDDIAPEERNIWQRTASSTNGLVSPSNVITIVGGVLVTAGLVLLARHENVWLAVTLIMIGRAADLADGLVADKTGTKSTVGEAMDATVDKLELVAAVVVIWLASLIPAFVFVILVVHAVYNSLLSLAEYFVGQGLHPSRSGKLAAAVEWVAIGLFVLDAGLNIVGGWYTVLTTAAWLLFAIFIILGIPSSIDYTKQLRSSRVKN